MNTIDIINGIVEYIRQKGFDFSKETVENMFLSLKSQPFVILCGSCGTGKSAIARLFAEAVGATCENGRFLSVAVEAGWNTPDNLVGHIKNDGNFYPGYITSFLKRAIDNPSVPYFLCLDEFNISRPEHYMSSVLSAMSTRRRKEDGTVITDLILSRESYGYDEDAYGIYGDLWLPDNLYIIATANFDECSYPLMPKVLDRAFVIELKAPALSVKFDFDEDNKSLHDAQNISNDFLRSEYITLKDCVSDRETLREYSYLIQDLNNHLKHLPAPVTYRSRDAMLFYYAYCRRYDIFTKEQVADLMIMQKFLVRIYGATTYVKNCLCDLFKRCLSRDGENSSEYANSSYKMYQFASKFGCKYPQSAEKITLMLRRYEEDGYASF